MKLEGSCHCGAVRFRVDSKTPYPYNWCYCSICRKTAGGGGYAINIMAEMMSLEIEGEENITVYRSTRNDRESYETDGLGFSRRHFCSRCGSALWVHNPTWPNLIHPFASAIDSDLPKVPAIYAIMTEYAAPWSQIPEEATKFIRYPDCGIEDWHKARALYGD